MQPPLTKEVRAGGWRRDLRNTYTEVALETFLRSGRENEGIDVERDDESFTK